MDRVFYFSSGSLLKTDFVARRKAIKEKEFEKYEQMFLQVHKEIKEGKYTPTEYRCENKCITVEIG